ncbi:MAG: hypothetical protein IH600_05740 [Bacteroidetes bacterium]|nr:hypothetical protein [Bacteroidota bacterium]
MMRMLFEKYGTLNFSPHQAAEIIGYSKSYLNELANEGKVYWTPKGTRKLIPFTEVLRIIREGIA